MGCSDLQRTHAKRGGLAAMRCLSSFPGGLLSAESAFEDTTNLAWKLPQHLPCLLWWELASKIGMPDSVPARLVVTYSELFPSQSFLLKTFFNIYGDSRVEILPVDECTHFKAWCGVECFPSSLPLSPLLSPHQCSPVGVFTRLWGWAICMLSMPASLSQGLLTRSSCCLEPVGFMKSNAARVLNGGASTVNVQVVVLC